MLIELLAPLRRGTSKREVRLDNRLAYFDQASFSAQRATGRGQVIQGVWIYEHPVDLDGLRRFHRDFGHGLYGRLIERSPLPFGRHRWVSPPAPPAPLDIAESSRPRADLSDWIDERAQLPIDPERGPGWHMAVQRFTDGATAVSLVGSHCLGDGIGALLSTLDAINGTTRDLGYPPPRSRTRGRALLTDAAQTVRAVPELARTLAVTAKLVFRRRHDLARSGGAARPAAPRAADGGDHVVVPVVTLFVDTESWDSCAASRGGTTYSLLAGFAAKLGERMGRRRADDGAVALLIAVSDRGLGDTRAHAMAIGNANVDPTTVTEDLSGVRAAVRDAIKAVREVPDESLQILPLIPFVPRRAMKLLADVFIGAADLPVTCSNVGELPPEIARIDGTDAEYVFQRGVDQNVTRQQLADGRGQLVLVSSRVGARIGINIVAYQPGSANSKSWLRELAAQTLAEFDLTGTVL
nr:hypothetical protein [Mycobacterium talmoniae]